MYLLRYSVKKSPERLTMPDTIPTLITFDDVLIVPQGSDVEPTEADTSSYVSKNVKIDIPIVSSPMDRVTETAMAIALALAGGIGIIHRNMPLEAEVSMVREVKSYSSPLTPNPLPLKVGAAIGPFDLERAQALDAEGVDVVVIDCAHGHNLNVVESARKIKKAIKADLVVGNIATAEAAEALCEFADGLRVGIGPGATCTTRIITGVGVPQLSAIMETSKIAHKHNVPVIADGGIQYSGDIVKALGAGASTIMNGSLLAGTDEAPGEVVTMGGNKYKTYRGMGSLGAITGTDRYGQNNQREKVVPEGIEGVVAYRGAVEDILTQLVGGLRGGMGYIGAHTIPEMHEKTKFVRLTTSGMHESHPHTMIQTKDQPNYFMK